MQLRPSCHKQLMECFSEVSKVDADQSTWDPTTWEVGNKWINKMRQYYEDATAQMKELGIDMEAGLTHLAVQGVDEVEKLERAEMVKETMRAEGIREDQDTRKTNTGDASACTGVTGGTFDGGTVTRAMANMDAKETAMHDKLKRS